MIKLTNISNGHFGNYLYVNPYWIVSVFEISSDTGGLKTIVYGGPLAVSWEVAESPEDIKKLMEKI